MDHVLNVQAIKGKMKNVPPGARLHHFFLGVPGQLSESEINDLKNVIGREYKKVIRFINSSKPSTKKTA